MIRGQRRRRDRDAGPAGVAAVGRSPLVLRLLLLAVAFATILMHHLAGVAHHQASEPAAAADHSMTAPLAASAGAVHEASGPSDPQPTIDHGAGSAPADTGRPGPVASPSSSVDPGSGDHGGAMTMGMHLCLAVLAAAIALAFLAVLLWRNPTDGAGPVGRARVACVGEGARPPPVPLRLAQLQVLRL